MKHLLFSIGFVFIYAFSIGQDKIVKKDMSVILCKVSEIGTTEIKYKKADNLDGPLYTIKKSEVWKIIFENGTEEVFDENGMSVVPTKNRNFKRAITTRPMSPLSGFLCLGYQHALSPSRALIAEIGWIGPGVRMRESANGVYTRLGFRLKRTPDIVMEGMEWGYNLSGMYVQPEIVFSTFKSDGGGIFSNTGGNFSSSALLISIGHQSIIGEVVTFDISGGLGYQLFNNSTKNEYRLNYFSHSTFGEAFPLAWKFSFCMGFMLK